MSWSDESQFLIPHIDGRVRVRIFHANSYPPLVQQVINSLVLAALCFGESFLGALGAEVFVEQIAKSPNYLNVIAGLLHSYM